MLHLLLILTHNKDNTNQPYTVSSYLYIQNLSHLFICINDVESDCCFFCSMNSKNARKDCHKITKYVSNDSVLLNVTDSDNISSLDYIT